MHSFHSSIEFTLSLLKLEAERINPSQKRSIKFSVGLPQPTYAFVSDVHRVKLGNQSTLYSSSFRSSPLEPAQLYFASKERDYWRRTNQSAYKDKKSTPPPLPTLPGSPPKKREEEEEEERTTRTERKKENKKQTKTNRALSLGASRHE